MTGNPNEVVGIVAHPDIISSIAVSNDSRYIFSCGGNDLSVNMWEVDTTELVSVVDKDESAASEEMGAFFSLLEGGRTTVPSIATSRTTSTTANCAHRGRVRWRREPSLARSQ